MRDLLHEHLFVHILDLVCPHLLSLLPLTALIAYKSSHLSTCFFPLFPFFFPCTASPGPSLELAAPLLSPFPCPQAKLVVFGLPLIVPSRVLFGLAGGNAGNAAAPPRFVARDGVRLGGADEGADEVADGVHGTVLILVFVDLLGWAEAGRLGKAGDTFVEDDGPADIEEVAPQDRVCDTGERDD